MMPDATSIPEDPRAAKPLVSVIVPAYNAMPFITECVTSALTQSLPAEQIELIVVDDGSTDGTGAELDRLATLDPRMRVEHQKNSGGPSAPRNRGMDLARGDYFIFIDADDYFGDEAIERMLGMALAHGSDIVLGKMVGFGGRKPPPRAFEKTSGDVDLFASDIYNALNPLKLFRRDLIEHEGLRFPTGFHFAEDQEFVAAAYFAASKISVVADYECYHIRLRDDGQNLTARPRTLDQTMPVLRLVIPLLEAKVPPGPNRDRLLTRHFRWEVLDALKSAVREKNADVQLAAYEELRAIVDCDYNDAIARSLPRLHRVAYYVFQHGTLDDLPTVFDFVASGKKASFIDVGGTLIAAYPFLDSLSVTIPLWCVDASDSMWPAHRLDALEWDGARLRLAGHVYGPGLAEKTTAQLFLRNVSTLVEHPVDAPRLPTPELAEERADAGSDIANAGFDVVLDFNTLDAGAALPDGIWEMWVRLIRPETSDEARLGLPRLSSVDTSTSCHELHAPDGSVGFALSRPTETGTGNLVIETTAPVPVLDGIRIGSASWSDNRSGTIVFEAQPAPELTEPPALVAVFEAPNRPAAVAPVVAARAADRGWTLTTTLPAAALKMFAGSSVRVRLVGETARGSEVLMDGRPGLPPARLRRGWRIYRLSPGRSTAGRLLVKIERVRLIRALLQRLRRT